MDLNRTLNGKSAEPLVKSSEVRKKVSEAFELGKRYQRADTEEATRALGALSGEVAVHACRAALLAFKTSASMGRCWLCSESFPDPENQHGLCGPCAHNVE